MVTRLYLTPEIVKEAQAPDKGERWIADTKIKGFGLRIWRTKSGEIGKAFNLRYVDKNGKAKRKTYSHREYVFGFSAYDWWKITNEDNHHTFDLGKAIEKARSWALDQIDLIHDRMTLQEEEEEQNEFFKRAIGQMSFERAAVAMSQNMIMQGKKQATIDRQDKLFALYVPKKTKHLPLKRIKEEHIIEVIDNPTLSEGNRRVLRPFLGKILAKASEISPQNLTRVYRLNHKNRQQDFKQNEASTDQFKDWWHKDFVQFIETIVSPKDRWQQRLCLLLYLDLYKAPLKRIMAAKWDQFYLRKYSLKKGKESNFFHVIWKHSANLSIYREERFSKEQLEMLNVTLTLVRRDFNGSPYLFPSHQGRLVSHIRSVDYVWRETLARAGLTYISPNNFRKIYHNKHMSYFERPLYELGIRTIHASYKTKEIKANLSIAPIHEYIKEL